MSLKETIGNKASIGRLMDTVRNDSVFHAYIFEGQFGEDRKNIAINFAKAILCGEGEGDACDSCISCRTIDHGNHGDILYITAEGSSIKDEVVEGLQDRMKRKPMTGERTIAIIDKADAMTLRAQNRLLKTLEEPLGRNIILLLAENAGSLTQTIRSRCILHRFNTKGGALMTGETAVKFNLQEIAAGLAEGQPLYRLSGKLTELGKNRELSMEALEILENWFRDMLLAGSGCNSGLVNIDQMQHLIDESKLHRASELVTIISHIEKTKNDLNMNLNAGYALKSMLLGIQEEKDDKSRRHQV